ncbi:hypothetical protein B0H13DRAFT_642639 [Mycena leptocephala]|nr:hypothetical protein B0H13DRAFT_642639 [Mycena leptocephala]
MKGTVICGEEEVKIRSSGEQVSPTPFTDSTALTLPERSTNGTRTNVHESRKYNQSKQRQTQTHARHLPPSLQIRIRILCLQNTPRGFMKHDNDTDRSTTTPTPAYAPSNVHFTTPNTNSMATSTSATTAYVSPPSLLPHRSFCIVHIRSHFILYIYYLLPKFHPFTDSAESKHPPMFQRRNTRTSSTRNPRRQKEKTEGEDGEETRRRAPPPLRAAAGASRLRNRGVWLRGRLPKTRAMTRSHILTHLLHPTPPKPPQMNMTLKPRRAAQAPQPQPPMQNKKRHTSSSPPGIHTRSDASRASGFLLSLLICLHLRPRVICRRASTYVGRRFVGGSERF